MLLIWKLRFADDRANFSINSDDPMVTGTWTQQVSKYIFWYIFKNMGKYNVCEYQQTLLQEYKQKIFHEYEQIPLNAYQPILFQEYQLVESWGLEEAQLAKCNVNAIKVPTDRHQRKLIKTSSFRHLSCPRERRRWWWRDCMLHMALTPPRNTQLMLQFIPNTSFENQLELTVSATTIVWNKHLQNA